MPFVRKHMTPFAQNKTKLERPAWKPETARTAGSCGRAVARKASALCPACFLSSALKPSSQNKGWTISRRYGIIQNFCKISVHFSREQRSVSCGSSHSLIACLERSDSAPWLPSPALSFSYCHEDFSRPEPCPAASYLSVF